MEKATVQQNQVEENQIEEQTTTDDQIQSQWKPEKSPRKIPIWVKSLVFFVSMLISIAVGLMVGYAVVGEGTKLTGIFDMSLWKHLYSFTQK